jgi:hypothetical protein
MNDLVGRDRELRLLMDSALDTRPERIPLFPLVGGLFGPGLFDGVVNMSGTQHQLPAVAGRPCALWTDRARLAC